MNRIFKLIISAALIATAIIAIEALGGWLIYVAFQGDWGKSGTFGDSFGAINTLFSGLGFGGVAIALIIQSLEIKESQRAQNENIRLALLTAKINSAISKQEIFANFLVNQKQFPGHESKGFGELRAELKTLMDCTDKLVQSVENELNGQK